VKTSKQGNVYVGKKCKKFSVFLDVFQNGSIYKVKGTKDFLSAAYSNIFTKSKGGFYHEEKCF
jgi:hypothetical protein